MARETKAQLQARVASDNAAAAKVQRGQRARTMLDDNLVMIGWADTGEHGWDLYDIESTQHVDGKPGRFTVQYSSAVIARLQWA